MISPTISPPSLVNLCTALEKYLSQEGSSNYEWWHNWTIYPGLYKKAEWDSYEEKASEQHSSTAFKSVPASRSFLESTLTSSVMDYELNTENEINLFFLNFL